MLGEIIMKIVMKLCPDVEKAKFLAPVVEETRESGINVFSESERFSKLVVKDYLRLGASFEERVQKLKECKEKGEIFFSLYASMARFELIEDSDLYGIMIKNNDYAECKGRKLWQQKRK